MANRERIDQKRRTRHDLLRAAARLMRNGSLPTLAEVAAEARVSRATAYRYFSSDKTLLEEAPLDHIAPTPEQLFAGDGFAHRPPQTDPVERLLKASAALHRTIWSNQTQFRILLARLVQPRENGSQTHAEPLRQNRRMDLIEAALAPARQQFDDASYWKLCAALALVMGTESMVVFRDVLQIDDSKASEVERWTIQALAQAALAESRQTDRGNGTNGTASKATPRRRR